jgi:hypothetical protein
MRKEIFLIENDIEQEGIENLSYNSKTKIINNKLDNSSINEENKIIPVTEKGKIDLYKNIKTLHDLNSDRTRKRSEQMRRIRSNRDSISSSKSFDIYFNNNNIKTIKPGNSISENKENINKTLINNNLLISYNENYENNDNNEQEAQNLNKSQADSVIMNESNAELNISDLDCKLNSQEEHNISTSTNKSFIPLTNNLITKATIKEDNTTDSYLLALNQYSQEDQFGPNSNDNDNEIKIINNDSLERPTRAKSTREVRHIRLPSVNY